MSRFGKVPLDIVPQLSFAELRVYAVLSAHVNQAKGYAWPTQAEIAGLAGLSDRGVRKAVAGLEGRGLLARGIVGRMTVYTLSDTGTGVPPDRNRGAGLPEPGCRSTGTGVPVTRNGGSAQPEPGFPPEQTKTDKEQTKNRQQARTRARQSHESLSALLFDERADGSTWEAHWASKYPELDGRARRPTVADAAAAAWDHTARRKYTDMTRYVGNWLREEARRVHYAWKREQTETESDGDRVLRALREEMAGD